MIMLSKLMVTSNLMWLFLGQAWLCLDAFSPRLHPRHQLSFTFGHIQQQRRRPSKLNIEFTASSAGDEPILTRVSEEDEGVPIPFVDKEGNRFIECYADSIATVEGEEYTIGVPCDYCVALCYTDGDNNLVPVELNDKLMDDIFPIAENVISEEFGEELVLQRTPQTLTLVGELEEDEDEEDDDEDGDDDEEDNDDNDRFDGEEEVELLLTFDHRDREYSLVRLMDPVLLVGRTDADRPDMRVLLTPEESNEIMPVLESAFLRYHED
jgi:hypothetical protein